MADGQDDRCLLVRASDPVEPDAAEARARPDVGAVELYRVCRPVAAGQVGTGDPNLQSKRAAVGLRIVDPDADYQRGGFPVPASAVPALGRLAGSSRPGRSPGHGRAYADLEDARMRMVEAPPGRTRGQDDGCRRYRPVQFTFDTRAAVLDTKVGEGWEPGSGGHLLETGKWGDAQRRYRLGLTLT